MATPPPLPRLPRLPEPAGQGTLADHEGAFQHPRPQRSLTGGSTTAESRLTREHPRPGRIFPDVKVTFPELWFVAAGAPGN